MKRTQKNVLIILWFSLLIISTFPAFATEINFPIKKVAISGINMEQNTIRIYGKVIDPDGNPITGAGVVCHNHPSIGTATDIDGNFSLSLPSDADFLLISSLGMENREYFLTARDKDNFTARDKDNLTAKDNRVDKKHSSQPRIIITLKFKENELDKVVVTGYGQTTVKRITGSVSIMNAEKFEAKPLSSVGALMQGEAAGVNICAVSGRAGVQPRIRIRGSSNLSGRSNPLWVIDGVPLQSSSPVMSKEELATGGFDNIFINGIGGLNPDDIESITILKDAAAAAIYGSRASNGVIVVSTKRGKKGKSRVSYSNNFTWSFKPQRNVNLMNSEEKLAWEQELWDEFSENKYQKHKEDPRIIFPVIGIVGQIRAGVGDFENLKNDKAAQEEKIQEIASKGTNWYNMLFRNAFSNNHHISLSGGGDKYTYYISGGINDENGMLIHNNFQRYNLNAETSLRPINRLKLEFGLKYSSRKSNNPYSGINPFKYAYFANPYERAYEKDGSYSPDHTWFSLGYFNGRGIEELMPKNGFNILRELNDNYTKTKNNRTSIRMQGDLNITEGINFTALASYSHSNNSSDKIIGENTYTAFRDRLGRDKYSETNLYGSISQNRTNLNSYLLRGHFRINKTFGKHNINILAGSELRGANSDVLFSKRYHYDPSTGGTSLPEISGPSDEWVRQVERLSGHYFTKERFASFYASADYYLGKTFVFNSSARTDGSSNFGNKRQFNPTWSAGAAWHISQENWCASSFPFISNATLRAAFGYTGDVNSMASHKLVMKYARQRFRYYDGKSYKLGLIPSAPNPNLGWEKTADAKIGLDLGFFDDRFSVNSEVYFRRSSDVVSYSQVQSTTGFSMVYFNSADIANSGIELTLKGKIINQGKFRLRASANFAYNYNKVKKFKPATGSSITSKDRYIENYPSQAILGGKYSGIDQSTGLYLFELRKDAKISKIEDLNNPDNYRYYLGTAIAPYSGGFNITSTYGPLRLSVTGVYSLGAKAFDKIISPASYLKARHEGVAVEKVQSQFSDLYSNHLNVTRDRINRWTEAENSGVLYPRIYDYFDGKYNFAASNPMDNNIVDAIYLKNISYLRLKSIILTYSLPSNWFANKIGKAEINFSLNNFLTLTNYNGMDPEVPGATYPTTRSVSVGLNIRF